jgi:hypothetical protein
MKRKSVIEVMFSLMLFLVFVFGSFFLLVSGAQQYKKTNTQQTEREEVQVPLAYISTKLHHAKSSSSVVLEDKVLKIHEDGYQTCIYEQDGTLYELVIQDGSSMDIGQGTKLYDVDEYDISYVDGLYVIDIDGVSMKVGVK